VIHGLKAAKNHKHRAFFISAVFFLGNFLDQNLLGLYAETNLIGTIKPLFFKGLKAVVGRVGDCET